MVLGYLSASKVWSTDTHVQPPEQLHRLITSFIPSSGAESWWPWYGGGLHYKLLTPLPHFIHVGLRPNPQSSPQIIFFKISVVFQRQRMPFHLQPSWECKLNQMQYILSNSDGSSKKGTWRISSKSKQGCYAFFFSFLFCSEHCHWSATISVSTCIDIFTCMVINRLSILLNNNMITTPNPSCILTMCASLSIIYS